jgi:hypothetical protein
LAGSGEEEELKGQQDATTTGTVARTKAARSHVDDVLSVYLGSTNYVEG